MTNTVKTEEKFISLISDTTIKYLFKNEDTKGWLIEIIKEKFNIDLNNYYLTSEEDNTGSKIKDYRMDLVFKNDNINEYIIIEATRGGYSKANENKAHQYLYRKASFGFDTGSNYKNPPKVKLIMLNNYKNQRNKAIMQDTYILSSRESNLTYDDITIHEIYLPVYHELCYDNLNKIDKRLWMFSCKNFDEMKNIKDENITIIEELRRLSMDETFIDEYNYENVQKKLLNSMRIEGYEEGLDVGVQKGRNEKNIENAKRMLAKGTDAEYISEITELSIDEINALRQE